MAMPLDRLQGIVGELVFSQTLRHLPSGFAILAICTKSGLIVGLDSGRI
jgi:hypothetical protein